MVCGANTTFAFGLLFEPRWSYVWMTTAVADINRKGIGPREWRRRLEVVVARAESQFELVNLDLAYCSPFDAVADLLTSLSLKSNSFSTVPTEVNVLTKLTALDLSENKLTEISSGPLRSLANLKRLKLDHNQLVSVDPRSFPISLEEIDVSFNKLSDVKFLAKLPLLRVARANNNTIRELPRFPPQCVVEELHLVSILLSRFAFVLTCLGLQRDQGISGVSCHATASQFFVPAR